LSFFYLTLCIPLSILWRGGQKGERFCSDGAGVKPFRASLQDEPLPHQKEAHQIFNDAKNSERV